MAIKKTCFNHSSQELQKYLKGKKFLYLSICYKLVEGFRVTCLFTGQCNTKGYDMITVCVCACPQVPRLWIWSGNLPRKWMRSGKVPRSRICFTWLMHCPSKMDLYVIKKYFWLAMKNMGLCIYLHVTMTEV